MNLDDHYREWFDGVYAKTLKDMPRNQAEQIEAAFYAGAGAALQATHDDDGETRNTAHAIVRHIERCRMGQVLIDPDPTT